MNTQTAPRTRPNPSPRDQQIYLDYQTTGRPQSELAAHYKLTQCRISQILRRVDRWLSVGWALPTVSPVGWDQAAPAAAGPPSPSFNPEPQAKVPYRAPVGHGSPDPAHLERRLDHQRLNLVCREAMQHFCHEQKTITHKTGTRGDKSFDETTKRTHPPSLQALKVILQATRQLEKVASKRVGWDKLAPASAGPPSDHPSLDDSQFRDQVINWLAANRDRSEKARTVSPDPDNHTLASELVKSFFGEPTRNNIAVHILARDIGKELVTAAPDTYAHRWLSRKQSADPSNTPQQAEIPREGEAPAEPENLDTGREDAVEGHLNQPPRSSAPSAAIPPPVPTTTSTTCAIPHNPTQPQPPPQLPIQNPKSKIQNKPHQHPYKPESSRPAADPLLRRLRHDEKLA